MSINTLLPPQVESLASFLRERRARLQPAPGAGSRRRTPGLRREEVAARAHVSVIWYTWLEQGRGGAPSSEVLERLAGALELDAAAREMMFLLSDRVAPLVAPAARPQVPASLQRVLDAMPLSPAIVKTPTWDIVAWNAAAVAVLGDYAARPERERNLLRLLFGNPEKRKTLPDWEDNVRWAVAVFRIDVVRCGPESEAAALAAELQAADETFRRIWADSEVRRPGSGQKRLIHPQVGELSLQYDSFAVNEIDGLGMLVFTPSTEEDRRKLQVLCA
jgi:transcriptional regulator with XRE-family HTH domain